MFPDSQVVAGDMRPLWKTDFPASIQVLEVAAHLFQTAVAMNLRSRSALRIVRLGLIVLLLLLAPLVSRAVILFRTANPAANTTPPTGGLSGSGWQFEGLWGSFLGTPIAPHFFLSAKHVGQAGASFSFGGTAYTLVKEFGDPNSDLDLWQVVETFPIFAPLYTKSDEVGKLTLVIGRGTQRGSEIFTNGVFSGWNWGPGDGVQRWG